MIQAGGLLFSIWKLEEENVLRRNVLDPSTIHGKVAIIKIVASRPPRAAVLGGGGGRLYNTIR